MSLRGNTEGDTFVTEISVTINGRKESVPTGSRIKNLLGSDEREVVAALLNSHLVSLDTVLTHDTSITTIKRTDPRGRAVLRRGAQLAFQSLIRKFFPELVVEIGQSLLGGYFYRVTSPIGVVGIASVADRLNKKMQALIKRDEPFSRELVSLEKVLEMVDDPTESRAKLLRTWPAPRAYLVSINDCYDIQHSVVPPSARYLTGVEVLPFAPGLVLRFGECCDELHPGDSRLLLDCYQETRRWNEMIEVRTVGELNCAVLEGRFEQVVRLNEALHEKKIALIADRICRQQRAKVICIGGPSSSGKSTFLKRLAVQLMVNGRRPLTISLDDYYLERKDGESVDLESPEALNLKLLNRQLHQLLDGQPINVPRFDFVKQRPTPQQTWRRVQLESNGVLLLEGLHALNPLVINEVPRSALFRVFVSALTQLIIDEHNRVPTSKVRLLRRITRDRKFRGSTTAEVLEQWPRVREGERKYIFPFQEHVECLFDSSLVYETAILKSFTWRYLLEVPRDHPTQGEAFRLLKFLELFVPVLPDAIPNNSLLQEFVSRRPRAP